jgi:type I restriction enzyme M protein
MDHIRELGQYFTPKPVVELCFRMLRTLDPEVVNPRIIDPACGDGAFLAHALGCGLTAPDRLFGIDKDPEIIRRLRLPEGVRLFAANSLVSSSDYADASFDWVVGNPPFGTQALKTDPGLSDLTHIVEDHYGIWRGSTIRKDEPHVMPEKLAAYPIEILFLERFLQLAKPGGYVAILVPDGILSNARLAYVREWLSERAEIRAIVSLPQHIFCRNGAWSKSSILLCRKRYSSITRHAPVFLAALESRSRLRKGIQPLADIFAASQSANRDPEALCAPIPAAPPPPKSEMGCPPWSTYIIDPPPPGDRLDPAYHHPKYIENQRFLESQPSVVSLGGFIEYTTYGQVGWRGLDGTGVRLITPANFVRTEEGLVPGIDVNAPSRFVSAGSRCDPPRSRLRKGDLLLVNSGVGCIGRAAVYASDEPANISQHINLIRLKGIEAEYLAVYFQTRFARLQIAREKCGVGACGINFERIRSILVPVLREEERLRTVRQYRRISLDPTRAATSIRRLVARLEKAISCLSA